MDIDIDTPGTFEPLLIFPNWVKASNVLNGELKPHPCGVYAQKISKDPLTHLSAIPYNVAEDIGFLKLDFLHNNVYNHFESKDEIDQLLEIEPEWNLLQIPSVHPKLFQLSKHGDLLCKIKPSSIEELADVLALIRPGKRELVDFYKSNKNKARTLLYSKDSKGNYAFKKSHAIAYAMVIVLQLHLIDAGII